MEKILHAKILKMLPLLKIYMGAENNNRRNLLGFYF